MPNYFGYPLVFVHVGENLVMANDVSMPSNPLVSLVEKKELEEAPLDEAPLDVNVSQRSSEEEPSRRVVCIGVDRLAWDHRVFPNPHALTIYLEFVIAHGTMLERFEECQCEDDNVHLHCRTWVPDDGHYRWLRGVINIESSRTSSRIPSSHHSSHSRFFGIMIYPF